MKWAGKIGFVKQEETLIDGEPSGIWEEVVTEREYTGDLTRSSFSIKDVNTINDSVTVSNQISFIADPYAFNNFVYMRYITFMNSKWRISNIDLNNQPRMIITLGEIYNAESN